MSLRLLLFCFLLFGLSLGSLLPAQTTEAPDALTQLHAAQQDPHARVYAKARALGDHLTAISALHHLLIQDPENAFLQDSLAAEYYYSGQPELCLAWSAQCLNTRPDSRYLLALSGQVAEGEGDHLTALDRYARLHAQTGAVFYRYQVASHQLQLGRHGECLAHIEAMLQSDLTAEQVHLAWSGGEGDVPLRAALLNLRGNLELAVNQENKARKSFRAALKASPGFGLARQNLNILREKDRERWENDNDR